MRKWSGIFIVGACFVFLGSSTTAYALQLSPTVLEKELSPGYVEEGIFQLTNPAEGPVHIKITVNKYRYNFGKKFIVPQGGKDALPSAVSWITITPSEVDLESKGSKVIQYSISIPEEARGEAVAEIFFDERPIKEGKLDEINTGEGDYKFKLVITARRAVPVYVMMDKDKRVSADIFDLGVEKDWFTEKISIAFKVKNTGNVHFRPKGTISIKSEGGREVISQSFSERKPLFPAYGEGFSVALRKEVPAGEYVVLISADIGAEKPVQKEKKFTITKEGEIK